MFAAMGRPRMRLMRDMAERPAVCSCKSVAKECSATKFPLVVELSNAISLLRSDCQKKAKITHESSRSAGCCSSMAPPTVGERACART